MSEFTAGHKYILLPYSRPSFLCRRTRLADDHFYHLHFLSVIAQPLSKRRSIILSSAGRRSLRAEATPSVRPSRVSSPCPSPDNITLSTLIDCWLAASYSFFIAVTFTHCHRHETILASVSQKLLYSASF